MDKLENGIKFALKELLNTIHKHNLSKAQIIGLIERLISDNKDLN